jgi:hypothetical protein
LDSLNFNLKSILNLEKFIWGKLFHIEFPTNPYFI